MNASVPTQAALLTPMGPGAIAVIALRGPDAERVVAAVTCARKASNEKSDSRKSPPIELNRPTLRRLVDGPMTLDDVLLLRRREAGGETERFEFHVHGGVRIVQRLLMLLERQGARVVDPQALADSSAAGKEIEQAVFAALLRAGSRRLAQWLLAQREILPASLAVREHWSTQEREAYERRTRAAIRLVRGIRIAIVGPPNAGKSTLANRLIGHERVITSDVPGTTRDWVEETALIDGWPMTLVDTAGVRETGCEIESEAIRRGAGRARDSDLILVVMDGAVATQDREQSMQSFFSSMPDPTRAVLILNKCDTPTRAEECLRAFGATWGDVARRFKSVVAVSALDGVGHADLEKAVLMELDVGILRDDLPSGFLEEHLEFSTDK